MKCPRCNNPETSVVDSRPVEESVAIRRRRECDACRFRFSTYEQIEILGLTVVKRSGERQLYARDKLERGIARAFEKRAVDGGVLQKLMSGVEREIQIRAVAGEIHSQAIGEVVMKAIKKIDKVAYIRFASVYRQFEDIAEFKAALQKL
ncbi:MAG: transcriptional repressor NrdR [Candidatus Doudnabacteria bacterium]|nr:transcriptional repressor NrdR [Candidatus Doudnabacteria bacterium]